MTRAEYLEFVQEGLAFPEEAHGADPSRVLREPKEVVDALVAAHARYCNEVEAILFPERALGSLVKV